MKGVVAAEFLTLLLLVGVLYLLWLHDERIAQIELDYDKLRGAVGELAAAKANPPTRRARPKADAAPPANGKAD